MVAVTVDQSHLLVVVDVDVVEPQSFVLLVGALPPVPARVAVLVRVVGVLEEGAGKGVHQHEGEGPHPLPQLLELAQQLPHALPELIVAVDEGVVVAEVLVDLLEEALDGGVDSPQGAVVELQLQLGDVDVAGFALEEFALEVVGAVGVEHDHEGLVAHLGAVLGVGGVVPAVLALEAHDQQVAEEGHPRPARPHLPRQPARLAVHREPHRLVLQELLLLERPLEVQLVPHLLLLPLPLRPHLLLGVLHAVAHPHQLLHAPPEVAHLHRLVPPGRVGVLDEGVAARVPQLHAQRKALPLRAVSQPTDEAPHLLVSSRVGLGPLRLGELQVVDAAPQEGLDGGDLGCLGRDGQVQFLEVEGAVGRADDFPAEVLRVQAAEEHLDAQVGQLPRELHFPVALPAVGAAEGGEQHLPEHGDVEHEEGGGAVLGAARTETLDVGG